MGRCLILSLYGSGGREARHGSVKIIEVMNSPLHLGQGARLEEVRIHACLIVPDDPLVILRGDVPEPCQRLRIIVAALFGVVTHHPDHLNVGLLHRTRHKAIADKVIGIDQHVVKDAQADIGRPAVKVGQSAQKGGQRLTTLTAGFVAIEQWIAAVIDIRAGGDGIRSGQVQLGRGQPRTAARSCMAGNSASICCGDFSVCERAYS